MKAVIYARYSQGGNQTDQSIEGQLRDCYEYAKKHDIHVVDTYIDRHISGTSDSREQFQRMIQDSERRIFDAVIVWKIDRFSRNRYDSAIYKTKLKKNGVQVLYAKESIPDGPEGIILESLLEGIAEYYSAELSVKIKRGMKESAHKCHVTGGYLALGYRIAEDKSFAIDERTAPIVQKIFTMYDAGFSNTQICEALNALGVKTAHGAAFNKNSLRTILKNKKYIGIYESQGIVVEGGVPALIDKELFDRVQARIAANAQAPGRRKAHVNYLLSGKLYCGHCGTGMAGESGTSKNGQKHNYYICTKKKREKACNKKTVRKDWLENLVAEETQRYILQPGKLDAIAEKCAEVAARDTRQIEDLEYLQKRLAETKRSIDNLIAAMEQGIITKNTKARLDELEATQETLEYEIELHKIKQPELTKSQISFLLSKYQVPLDEPVENYKENILSCFVNSVHLYDDHLVIAYNLTNKKNELESSFLSFLSDPSNPDYQAKYAGSDLGLFVFNGQTRCNSSVQVKSANPRTNFN